MRKITLILSCLLISGQFMFAQMARDKVVVELFTGPQCPFCPAASNGIKDMLNAGLQIAPVSYHTTAFSLPQFYTPETNARAGYYSFSGYPTAFFDGGLSVAGGGNSGQTTYPQYLNRYNQRINVPAQFDISLTYENIGGSEYEATVVIEKLVTTTYTNLVLQLILTESHIPWNWLGMTELSWVTRDMIPNQNGTPLDFSSSNIIELTLPFTFSSQWVKENCDLIAFVQNNQGKEIMQGVILTMNTPEHNLDAQLFKVDNVPDELCSGLLQPEITIRNVGAEILTSVNINFEVNGELVYTYPWTGSLHFTEQAFIEIPEFEFNIQSENQIDIYLSDPNNGIDENPDNDHHGMVVENPEIVTNYLLLLMMTDANPQETSWEVTDGAGEVLKSGGPYSVPSQFIIDTIYYTGIPGCHRFIIYDTGGNGLTTYYTIRSFIGGSLVTIGNGNQFGYKEITEFSVDYGVGIDDQVLVDESVEVFPNPVVNTSTIRFNLAQGSAVSVELFNSAGKLVKELSNSLMQAGTHEIMLDANDLNTGVYFIKIEKGDQVVTRKIAVVK